RNAELIRLDSFDDALREFITAIVVVMRVVVGYERALRWLDSPSFVERLTHRIEVDQRHVFFSRYLSYRFRIIAVRVRDLAIFIERAPLHRRDQHGNAAALSCAVDKLLQIGFVSGEGADAFALFLLVVVAV